MDDFDELRCRMVANQIERRGVTSTRVLAAMRTVPRHLFVPEELRDRAYEDYPLPIGYEQTISQPYIVALMTSLLGLEGKEKVLEIGTGSGYQAAVLSRLAEMVHSVELVPQLARQAAQLLTSNGYVNVQVHCADGSLGWPAAAPYDAVLVTANAPRVPQALLQQLTPAGRLVLPVGGRGYQHLERWTYEHGTWQPESILPVAFVPLRGRYGWKEGEE